MMWYPIHSLNLNILTVTGRSDLFLKLEIAKKTIGLTFMCCFLPMGLVAFCYACIGSEFISLAINTWYTKTLYDYGLFKQLKDLIPTLLLCLALFVAARAMTYIFDNLYVQILTGATVAAVVYLGGALLFKFEELNDVKFLLNRK